MVRKPVAKVRRARRSASAVRKRARKVARKSVRKSVAKTRLKRRTPGKAPVKAGKAGAAILRGSPPARLRASSTRYGSHLRMTEKGRRAPTAAPKPKRGGVVSVPKTYSTELLANGRHRYEQTDEPVAAIAADFRIQPGSLRRLAHRLGWIRFGMAPKQLPVTARLLEQADDLAAAHADVPASVDVETIARIERQVLREIADIEAARAQLRGQPRPMREAESTARALTTLTDTLQKLQRLRLPLAAAGQGRGIDDDLPEDIDEFRLDLARRINAFVASRTHAGDGEAAGAAAPVAPVRP